MSVPSLPVAAHAAATRRPSAASVTCALARSGIARSIASVDVPRAHPAAKETQTRTAAVAMRMSELRSHAELERPRLAHSEHLAEGRRWIGGIGAGAEVAVHRDHVGPVREVEAFDESLDAQAIAEPE